MKNAVVGGVAVVAVALGVWVWSESNRSTPKSNGPAPESDAPRAVEALPAFDGGVAAVDAGLQPDAALTAERVREAGLFGRPATWVDGQFLNGSGSWKKVADAASPTFTNERGVVARVVVEGDKVVGARIEFPKTAATADVQTLSPQLVGFRTALDPQGYQMADQKLGTQRSGEFTTAEGRKVYWKGEVFNATPPARPIWMEYRLSPF